MGLNRLLDLVDQVSEEGLEAKDLGWFTRLHHFEQALHVNKALKVLEAGLVLALVGRLLVGLRGGLASQLINEAGAQLI